ncbi:hypothetical protein [Streptomyces griseorubiginosus]|uniref:hypothetical protein n=1 Tax=Streptomyces griseorubiginosus TaxID=67304 RepID=UPI0036EEF248
MTPQPVTDSSFSPVVELIDGRIPGFKAADSRNRWKIVIFAVILCIATALTASYFQFGFSLFTMGATASAEDAANDAIEARKPPFTMAVTSQTDADYVVTFPGDALFLFKDPLTEKEQKMLARLGRSVGDPRGDEALARMILTSFHEKPTVMYAGIDVDKEPSGRSVYPLKLTLQSSRSESVTIRDMEATNIRCSATDVSAVVFIAPQGGGASERVGIDLVDAGKSTPLMETKGEYDWNYQPYFSDKFIELGGGEPSWAANLEVMAADRQCRWDFEASYVESGENKTTRLKSRYFSTPGYPAEPSQLFEFLPSEQAEGFSSTCWGEKISKNAGCDVWAPKNDKNSKSNLLYYWDFVPFL